MSNNPNLCPVCGALQSNLSSVACGACGCTNAFVTLFSGDQAYALWKASIDQQIAAKNARLYADSRDAGCTLRVTSNGICFHNPKNQKAVICHFDGSAPTELDNIKEIDLCNLYRLAVHPNGALSYVGDDYYDQRRGLSAITNAVSATTSLTCAYIVTASGNVIEKGANDFNGIPSGWTDIQRIAANQLHIVGLKKDGTVVYSLATNSPILTAAQEIDGWSNVKDIAVGNSYILALHNDGTVSYAGVKDAHAAATEWRNIVSVAIDSQYAIGLTESGEVLLAGDVSPFVDYGRNQAKQWKDMSFIAAGDSLIIGLTNKGSLQMVGNPNLYKADNFDIVCTKAINALIK